ncbi:MULTISPECIES: primase alpha helix C-terminal domain-containing protein [Staphylococcus]|uniref:primase alpha helix C-terminal domain-containing protein n=1 Tax=Staphylococcus TaxID=1279 RepID=UPI001135475F|nr:MULTISPECIES: primase alpha helix C-terminal domain-containing protein [Staphylococcus]MDT4049990.1 primase alpha helix C-terminal domain-containing protein [Staphylococcus arlettae]MDW3851324.1 primase alpha helix C-terminal domain-containing protein [Staphylococcus saprophyticus]MDW4395550.1 primase alpha helix C-terminal domain-containing protein [Staphylococcus saprophyticus]MEB7309902.1 primase alpha helix C-terminal domain-containing protein [Staphylococcus saprophyticus]BBK28790.1 re
MGFEQIKLQHDIRLNIIEYKNLSSYSFVQTNDVMWSEWLNRLQTPMNHNEKYQRGLVVYGDVKDVEQDGKLIQKYRNDENIINRNTLALDYDDIEDFKGLYSAICKQLEGFCWAFHTTYNHTTEKPRIRLMVPVNEPVSADDYRKYTQALAQKIGYKIDEGSFQPSRAMALPVKPDKNIPYIFKYNDAPAITIGDLNELSRNINSQKNKPITINYSSQYKKRDSSYWRDIAFGVGEGERNQTLASLIGYLLRRYVDVNLVYGLAIAWAQQCTPPIDDKEVNNTFRSILKKDLNR